MKEGPEAKVVSTKSNRPLWFAALILIGLLCITGSAFFLKPKKQQPPSIPVVQPQPDWQKLGQQERQLIEAQFHALSTNLTSSAAWGAYGLTLRAYDLEGPALQCFEQAAALDPREPRWPFHAYRLLRGDDPTRAFTLLSRSVQLAGNNPPAPRYYLAKWLGEEGRWDEALREASSLLEADPKYLPAQLIKAQAAMAKGEFENAGNLAKECIEDPRTSKAAWALLSSAFSRIGKADAAAEAARRSAAAPLDKPVEDRFESEILALRLNPRSISDKIHPLLAARKFNEAAPLIQELITRHPDFSETWLIQGRYLLLQKQPAQAEAALRKHLEIEPTSTQGYFQLGIVYLNMGNFNAAETAFRQAISIKNDFGPAWFNLGVALGRNRKMGEAITALEQALRFNPEYLDAYILLADALINQGRIDQASKTIAEAEKINPADPRLAQLRKKAEAAAKR